MDYGDYIINMLALQLARELESYLKTHQDVNGSAFKLEAAVREYCNTNHLSNE